MPRDLFEEAGIVPDKQPRDLFEEAGINATKEPSFFDKSINALRGFSARGNQAMNALNPLADDEDSKKIASEQEWVKQNEGAGLGSILADIAITSPAAGPVNAGLRAISSGAIEGLTHSGSLQDKLEEMAGGTVAAGLGEGAANVVSYLAKPFTKTFNPISDVTDAIRQKASQIPGFKLNAAQETGNKTLQYADSALDFIPSSSSMQQEAKEGQRLAWQKALFKQGGEDAQMATQQTMGNMLTRISGDYKDVATRNELKVDAQFKADLSKVKNELMARIPTNQKSIVKSYLKDFDTAPQGAFIPGAQYQEIRSMLDKQSKAFKNSDPATHEALKSIRNAADKAMERSVSPADFSKLKKANNDWAVMKSIESGIDAETATISPAKLLNSLASRDKNRVIYGAGDQGLNDIAKIGKAFVSPKTADSGTAQRAAMIKLLTGAGALGAGTDLANRHDTDSALLSGLGAMGLATVLPRAASKALWKENGYLSKGLIDLSKQVVPGISRERIIKELLRNSALQTQQN